MGSGRAALPAIAALIALGAACHRPARAAGACAAPDARIVVDTAAHRLLLCDHTDQAAAFGVRIGSGGAGKSVAASGSPLMTRWRRSPPG